MRRTASEIEVLLQALRGHVLVCVMPCDLGRGFVCSTAFMYPSVALFI